MLTRQHRRYPYFQNTMPNDVTNGYSLFNAAYEATVAAVGDKPVYITETGWPVSGSTSNQAVPGTANAQTYWDQVGCNKLFGQINTWWFTLQDSNPTTPNPSFGIMGTDLTGAPLFDLSCSGVSTSVPSSPIPAASATADAVSINAAGAGNEGTPNTAANGGASSSTSSSDVSNTAIAAAAGSLPVTTGSSTAQPEEDAPLMTTYTTVTTCPVTTTSEGKAITTSTTSTVIIESCLGGCSSKTAIAAEAGVPTTLATITKTSVLPKASASGVSASSCPASLSGAFEYPHLIVPISKDSPTTAGGTSYNGTFSSTESAIFNFDIPASDSGKTCSLVFLLPTQAELTTSAFSLSGSGGLDVAQLKSAATEETSYNTVPAVVSDLGGPTDVTPGNAYIISSGSCAAGQTLSYEVSATGSLDLNYFQDYNLPPIGFYITVC